jgi:hypothetical protein
MSDLDEHFIGWLPMPRAYRRFLVPVAAGVVAAVVALAAVIAGSQQSPGAGRWDDGQPVAFTGVAYADPYATVRVPGENPGDPPVTLLLVEGGKFGAGDRVRPFDGRAVRVAGTLLARDGWRMLELAAGDDGLRAAELPPDELARLRRPPARPLGAVTLRGEIVDAKCYLGAMKPGGGRTHRGCAVLCLRGGVPPLFVSDGAGDGPSTYLLASESLGPIDAVRRDTAGLPTVLEGTLEQLGDLPVLRLTAPPVRGE